MVIDVCYGGDFLCRIECLFTYPAVQFRFLSIRLKTAVLLACALKMGAIMGNAPKADTETLYQFGINIGLAFQLQDDLLDVYDSNSMSYCCPPHISSAVRVNRSNISFNDSDFVSPIS